MSKKILACNTRAVLDKTKDDFFALCFWVNIIVQIVFLLLYGYKIYTNLERFYYFIIYVSLASLTVITFLVYIFTYNHRRNKAVKITKRFFKCIKYLLNFTMLFVVYFEMFKYGSSDIDKLITIFSTVSLFFQIVIEISRILFEKYLNLITIAVKMDVEPIYEKVENLYNAVKDPTGNLLATISYIPKKIADLRRGKQTPEEIEEEKTENYTGAEKKVIKLAEEYNKSYLEEHGDREERFIQYKLERHKRQREELKEHFKTIFLIKKKDKKEKENKK